MKPREMNTTKSPENTWTVLHGAACRHRRPRPAGNRRGLTVRSLSSPETGFCARDSAVRSVLIFGADYLLDLGKLPIVILQPA